MEPENLPFLFTSSSPCVEEKEWTIFLLFLPPCRHFVGERIEFLKEEDEEAERNSRPPSNEGSLNLTTDGDRNGNIARNRGTKRKEAFSPYRSSKNELLVIAGLDDPDEDLDRDVGDDDDDEDEECPGRAPANCDIERLKAFNVIQSYSFIPPIYYLFFNTDVCSAFR